MKRSRLVYSTAAALAVAMGVLCAWFLFAERGRTGAVGAAVHDAPTTEQPAGPGSSRVMVGRIEPGEIVSVAAPFDGVIAELGAGIGSSVAAGDLLFAVESPDALAEHRSATIALKSAELKLRETIEWQKGTEARNAQRSLEQARQKLEESRQRLAGTERLYREGLVSRDEATTSRNSVQDAERDLIAQQEALDGLQARNSSAQRSIARLEYENALAKQRGIAELLGQARVKAGRDGVVLPAPASSRGGGESTTPEWVKGTKVSRGTTVMMIGDMSSLRVRVAVHELDLQFVRPDKKVSVTGPAFPGLELTGMIESVSAQAGAGVAGPPQMFNAVVRIAQPTREQLQTVRIGMSADVRLASPVAGQR